jgi:hypothetical protein
MSWRKWLAILLLVLAGTSAEAAPPSREGRDCRGKDGVDRCAEAELRRRLAVFGLDPIERHREAGDQVRRALYVDGYGRDMVAIAYVRPRGRDPVVRVHFRRREGEAQLPTLEAPVPQGVWDDLLRRSARFDRTLDSVREVDDGTMLLCIHGWDYTIEAYDPYLSEFEFGEVRRKTENACDEGLVEILAQEMYEAAIPLLPPCALLDRTQYRNGAVQLMTCGRLRGDRLAAAAVVNRLDRFKSLESDPFWPLEIGAGRAVEDLFDSEAVVDWNGERNGEKDPVAFLISKLVGAERSVFIFNLAEGERADRVRVTGALERTTKAAGKESTESAPVEQIWVRNGDDFDLESMKIGPFGPLE